MNRGMYRIFTLGLSLAACVGCGSSEPMYDEDPNVLNSVMGSGITLDGKSIPSGAIVTLHPKEAKPGEQISGVYNGEERYFTVMTVRDGEKLGGAPEGNYTMTIQPPRNKPASVPAKYGNPATSGLSVEVKAGANSIPETKLTP